MNSHRPAPVRNLTRAERFAALAAERAPIAPLYKIGDRVRFESREGRVTDLHAGASGYLVTVATYAGTVMVGDLS